MDLSHITDCKRVHLSAFDVCPHLYLLIFRSDALNELKYYADNECRIAERTYWPYSPWTMSRRSLFIGREATRDDIYL